MRPVTTSGKSRLPELSEAILDDGMLNQLFQDLEQCAQIAEIIPKHTERQRVTGQTISLAEARQLLEGGQARGVQIRYRYQGADWWDTLLRTPEGFRLVRMRHEFH